MENETTWIWLKAFTHAPRWRQRTQTVVWTIGWWAIGLLDSRRFSKFWEVLVLVGIFFGEWNSWKVGKKNFVTDFLQWCVICPSHVHRNVIKNLQWNKIHRRDSPMWFFRRNFSLDIGSKVLHTGNVVVVCTSWKSEAQASTFADRESFLKEKQNWKVLCWGTSPKKKQNLWQKKVATFTWQSLD